MMCRLKVENGQTPEWTQASPGKSTVKVVRFLELMSRMPDTATELSIGAYAMLYMPNALSSQAQTATDN